MFAGCKKIAIPKALNTENNHAQMQKHLFLHAYYLRNIFGLYGTLRHIFYLLEQVGPFHLMPLLCSQMCVGRKCINLFTF